MGTIYSFRCPCGYAAESLSVGYGFLSYSTGLSCMPAYCPRCKRVVLAKYRDPLHTSPKQTDADDLQPGICPRCHQQVRYYDDPHLSDPSPTTGKGWDISCGEFRMPSVGLFCPKCKQMTMEAFWEGLWD